MVNIESTSNAIWWIKNPNAGKVGKADAAVGKGAGGKGDERKASLGSSFSLDMVELLRNISLQGYNKLLAPELTLLERLIWLALHMTTFLAMLAVLLLTWEQFIAQYFVINLKDPLYPVENVPFPAVSICPNNRLSMQSVFTYARELQSNDPAFRQVEYFAEQLKYLSKLYVIGEVNDDVEEYLNFQAFLDLFGTWNNETFFNTRRIMKLLSPKCEEYILKCSLSNIDIPCFSATAFQESLTKYGPCCTFNTQNTLKNRDFKNRFANSAQGLTVVINASHADYFAPILHTNGYIVIVHDANNFPSIASSNSLEMFPGQREESFLKIFPRIIDTDKSLHSFSPTARRCYFHSEANMPDLNKYVYTFPNCITRCRIRSIIALCNCLPFQLPLELVDSLEGLVFCTLTHISCLSQYQFKWNNVLTERERIYGLEREIEEALYCPHCLPSCNDVQYRISMSVLPIDNYLATVKPDEDNETDITSDISVLRVFFGEPHAHLYTRLLNNQWFEIFSTIGNILSIFMGFSLVAIFELSFYFFKYIYIGCNRIIERNRANNHAKMFDASKLHIYP
ncbi:sodium channel protein Nach [Drosophila sulfurigaster albostrigata]|uniref:sodium channel protein Nach n=2 Tax=nasuta subgroup TaxID=32307 RepID=UPI002D219E61|nr:sodium channel protein Nach [Drosophila sulfurigaster albostrigata]